MSKCGSCQNKRCTCQLNGDGTSTKTLGLGTTYSPIQVRPLTPAYRPVGAAYRTSTMTITANTDMVVSFQSSDNRFNANLDMWQLASPTRLTAPIDGLYLIGGFGSQGASGIGGVGQSLQVWITKNGIVGTPLVKRSINNAGAAVYNFYVDVCTLVRLSANDYLELYLRSNSTFPSASGGPDGSFSPPYLWANWMGA
jgi:hypothetical protein